VPITHPLTLGPYSQVSACLGSLVDYFSTDFDVDSSSCIPFRADTHKLADVTDSPTDATMIAINVGNAHFYYAMLC